MFTVTVIESARKELKKLPINLRADTYQALLALKEKEVIELREPLVRNIRNGLKELRVSSYEGISRSFFFFEENAQIFVVHILQKKTQQTPQQSIELAIERMKTIKRELNNDK